MRTRLLCALASAVVLSACVFGPEVTGPVGPQVTGPVGSPPVPEGWDPEGRDQVVTYHRSADDAVDIGVQVNSASGSGWHAGGTGSGCQGVSYPWSLGVGPREGDPNQYREIANSGDVTGGTFTFWMDSGPDGVTIGWGKPDWALDDSPMNCGE